MEIEGGGEGGGMFCWPFAGKHTKINEHRKWMKSRRHRTKNTDKTTFLQMVQKVRESTDRTSYTNWPQAHKAIHYPQSFRLADFSDSER